MYFLSQSRVEATLFRFSFFASACGFAKGSLSGGSSLHSWSRVRNVRHLVTTSTANHLDIRGAHCMWRIIILQSRSFVSQLFAIGRMQIWTCGNKSNNYQFAHFFYCQNQEKICNSTITKCVATLEKCTVSLKIWCKNCRMWVTLDNNCNRKHVVLCC